MITYAKATIDLWERHGDDSVLTILTKVEKDTGKWNPDLHPDPPPPAVEYLWGWFLQLHVTRKGSDPLGYQDIAAWSALLDRDVQPQEVEMLRRMDGLFISMLVREVRNRR